MTRRLHIGGEVRTEGWEVFNIAPGPHVDHAGDANDLSRFEDGTFAQIYASHVLEHFPMKSVVSLLSEWRRVLGEGGSLMVSVPDLKTLCRLFLTEGYPIDGRHHLVRIMYGGQCNEHDFHYGGYDQELLYHFLKVAGFTEIKRVRDFGIFEDSNGLKFDNQPISLNLIGHKETT